jgi:hypothetical protein
MKHSQNVSNNIANSLAKNTAPSFHKTCILSQARAKATHSRILFLLARPTFSFPLTVINPKYNRGKDTRRQKAPFSMPPSLGAEDCHLADRRNCFEPIPV